jgi:hypothetical protein
MHKWHAELVEALKVRGGRISKAVTEKEDVKGA